MSARAPRVRPRPLGAAAAAGLSLAAACAAVALGAGSTPAAANLWVDPSGGTCTRSASPAAYADAAACGSLAAAWAAAAPGDTVLVKGGSYGAQSIGVRAAMSAASTDVTVATAAGETATIDGDLSIAGSHVAVAGPLTIAPPHRLVIDDPGSPTTGSDRTHAVTVSGLKAPTFYIGPVGSAVTLTGDEFGPYTASPGNATCNENTITGSGSLTPNGITLDGVSIHGQNTSDAVNCHTGGMLVQGGTSVTIRGSRFYDNAIYDVLWDDFTGSFGLRDWTLENDWFGGPVHVSGSGDTCPSGYAVCAGQADLQWKWNGVDPTGWLVRFNSFGNGMAPDWGDDAGPTWSGFRVIGNAGGLLVDDSPHDWRLCEIAGRAGVTIKDNAWTPFDNIGAPTAHPPTCGDPSNVTTGPPSDFDLTRLPFSVDGPIAIDFHLRPGSVAQDLVTATGTDFQLARDIDGDARPQGPARDAGADEVATGAPAPTPTATATPTPTPTPAPTATPKPSPTPTPAPPLSGLHLPLPGVGRTTAEAAPATAGPQVSDLATIAPRSPCAAPVVRVRVRPSQRRRVRRLVVAVRGGRRVVRRGRGLAHAVVVRGAVVRIAIVLRTGAVVRETRRYAACASG